GMDVLPTGETIGEAFATARARWGDFDFFFVHWKATDMAGEDGDFDAKVAAVEQADVALPALLDLKPDVLCVTGDHSTPVLVRGSGGEPGIGAIGRRGARRPVARRRSLLEPGGARTQRGPAVAQPGAREPARPARRQPKLRRAGGVLRRSGSGDRNREGSLG